MENFEKFEVLRNCNAGDTVATTNGEIFKFVKLNRKNFIGVSLNDDKTYSVPVEIFKRVVNRKVVNIEKYKEVKVGEFFYIDNNGKGALLFKFLGMKNGKMLGEDPINNTRSLIATSLYAGKVKDLA